MVKAMKAALGKGSKKKPVKAGFPEGQEPGQAREAPAQRESGGCGRGRDGRGSGGLAKRLHDEAGAQCRLESPPDVSRLEPGGEAEVRCNVQDGQRPRHSDVPCEKEHPKFLTVQDTVSQQSSLVQTEEWEKRALDAPAVQRGRVLPSHGQRPHSVEAGPMDPKRVELPGLGRREEKDGGSLPEAVEHGSGVQPHGGGPRQLSELEEQGPSAAAARSAAAGQRKGRKGLGKRSFGKGQKEQRQRLGTESSAGHEGQLALQDGKVHEEEETEESWHKALQRAKKARDQMSREGSDLETAIKVAVASKRLTKLAKAEAENTLKECQKYHEALKVVLVNQDKGLSFKGLKELLAEAAEAGKPAKEEIKELNQLSRKAASKASKEK